MKNSYVCFLFTGIYISWVVIIFRKIINRKDNMNRVKRSNKNSKIQGENFCKNRKENVL
jgi:hypothetical protein